MLAVDRGGRNLDMSTGFSERIIGTDDGIAEAKWKVVPSKKCQGIRHKRKSKICEVIPNSFLIMLFFVR